MTGTFAPAPDPPGDIARRVIGVLLAFRFTVTERGRVDDPSGASR